MGTQKRPHLRTTKTGKVIKVGLREGEPAPSLVYNKPKTVDNTSGIIFKPKEVKKAKQGCLEVVKKNTTEVE
jgi:hypothetical protein